MINYVRNNLTKKIKLKYIFFNGEKGVNKKKGGRLYYFRSF